MAFLPGGDMRARSRIAIDGLMTYRLENSSRIHQGQLENLSDRGALLWINQLLLSGSRLFCSVIPEDPKKPIIEFTATLARSLSVDEAGLYGYDATVTDINLPD